MTDLSNIIKSRRETLNISLTALASQIGVAKSYLSMIENKKVNNPPSKKLLVKLEKALEFPQGKLTHQASWEKTPEQVKKEFNKVSDIASKGQQLARWIHNTAENKKTKIKSLDQLYKSGQLKKHINQILNNTQDIQPIQTTTPPQQIPLINHVAAGYPTEFTDKGYPPGFADQYIHCPDISDPDAFACKVIGDSMAPKYQENDIIVFSPLATVQNGSDCFVRIKPDHETTFKRVYFEGDDTKKQKIRLQPLNPQFPPHTYNRQQIAGIYRAVSRIQKL